jgi:formylglycine-generating enzyme required for sulfatase activity
MPVRYEFCQFCSRIYDAEAASSCPHCASLQVPAVPVPQGQAPPSEPNETPARDRYRKLAPMLAWSVPVILLTVALGIVVRTFSKSKVVPITGTPLTASKEQAPKPKDTFNPALKPKDTFKDCANCPEMVVVPAGTFTMGSPASERWRETDEGPQHAVTIARPYAVGQFALTFDQWDACVADGGCNGYRPSDQGWGRGHRPVINVSWDDAKAYVLWLAQKTGKPYRLLTEAEYEYAARAGTTTAYPWGNAIGKNNANCDGCGSQWDNKQTAPVGSFAANGFGLNDMVGNVRQWVEDCYDSDYNGAPIDGAKWTTGDCSRRVVRGGSWFSLPRFLRSAGRVRITSGNRSGILGFRVALTLLDPTTSPAAQPEDAIRAAFAKWLGPNNFDNIKPRKTVVANGYAVQNWDGHNTGGQTLLKYAQPGWIVVINTAGKLTVDELTKAGVPIDVAATLSR